MANITLNGSELVPLQTPGGAPIRVDRLFAADPELRIPLLWGGGYVKVGEVMGTGGYTSYSPSSPTPGKSVEHHVPLLSGGLSAPIRELQRFD